MGRIRMYLRSMRCGARRGARGQAHVAMSYRRRRFGQERGAAKQHLEHEDQQRGSNVFPHSASSIHYIPAAQLTQQHHQSSPARETRRRNRSTDKVPANALALPATCESPHVQSDRGRSSARFLQRPSAHHPPTCTHTYQQASLHSLSGTAAPSIPPQSTRHMSHSQGSRTKKALARAPCTSSAGF